MICPKCGREGVTKVINTREKKGECTVYRRRECTICGVRFSTIEKWDKFYTRRKKKNGQGS